jgi:MscS family membrane protein
VEETIKFISDLAAKTPSWLGGADLWRIVAAFVVVMFVLLLRRVVTGYVIKRLQVFAKHTRLTYDEQILDAVTPGISGLFIVLGVYLATRLLPLPTEPVEVDTFIRNALVVAAAVLVIYSIHRLCYVAADALDAIATHGDPEARGQFRVVLRQILSITTWIIGALVVVQNLGYSISSVLAGLGIGGLAVALGAQETLGNFFGSVMLLTDRPFKVGDWIQVDDMINGDVEEIGFRSTKVRAWDKSLVSIPNKSLASKVIKNWSRMPKRRVKQIIGVTYDTPREKMQALVDGIERLLREDPSVHQEYIMVKFTDFSAYSLDILVYYFTKDTAWMDHLQARQDVNLKIMHLVEELGLSFAFPTQTLHVLPEERQLL